MAPGGTQPQPQPQPHVLAIASHVTYGYVGNKMVTTVMQLLGCEVSAIHTVEFSNHTAYRQFAGRKTPAGEMQALYDGLVAAGLHDMDMLLSGYTGTAEGVETVGRIARDLRARHAGAPGGFFWILDPVMGDNGRLYVDAGIPAVYASLLPHADLILPNAFEAETLTGMRIASRADLARALAALHTAHRVPHVVITSVSLPDATGPEHLAVVGSSARGPGAFMIRVPRLPVFFSGTGDMFAALLAVRLREEAAAAGLLGVPAWAPREGVPVERTPLARAAVRALQSMQAILAATAAQVSRLEEEGGLSGDEAAAHLRRTKASEIRVPRFVEELKNPEALGVELEIEPVVVPEGSGDDGA